jgi:hypothetical protein
MLAGRRDDLLAYDGGALLIFDMGFVFIAEIKGTT